MGGWVGVCGVCVYVKVCVGVECVYVCGCVWSECGG